MTAAIHKVGLALPRGPIFPHAHFSIREFSISRTPQKRPIIIDFPHRFVITLWL
jgi:hypothetical protein